MQLKVIDIHYRYTLLQNVQHLLCIFSPLAILSFKTRNSELLIDRVLGLVQFTEFFHGTLIQFGQGSRPRF